MMHRRLRVWGSLALALVLGAPLGAVGHAAVLFQDDFSGTLGAWTTDGSGISGTIVGGALQVTGSGDGFFRTIQTFSPTPGYTLEFDVVTVGATSFVSPCVGVTGFNSPGQGYLIDGNMITGMANLYHRLNSAWTYRQGSAMRSNPASGDRVAVTVVPNGANFDVYFWRNSCLNALTQAPAANPVITGGVGIRMTLNRTITVDNFVVTDTLPDPNIAPPGYLFRDDFSNPLRYGWYYQGAAAGIQTNPSGQLVLDARVANDGWMLTRTAFNPASTYTVSFDIAQLLMAPGNEGLGVILGGGNFAAAGSNDYLFDFRTVEEEVRIFLRSNNAWTQAQSPPTACLTASSAATTSTSSSPTPAPTSRSTATAPSSSPSPRSASPCPQAEPATGSTATATSSWTTSPWSSEPTSSRSSPSPAPWPSWASA